MKGFLKSIGKVTMKKIELLIFGALMIGPPLAESEEIKIHAMSFNIRLGVAEDGPNHWNLRKELVFDVLRDHQPDVVGIQEAWKIQIDALKAAFPGFGIIGRSRQEDPEKGEWCPILYRKEKFEVVSEGTFWLSDTPGKEGTMSWGNSIPRICTWGRFKEKNTGRTFFLYNTHFDHQSQASREKSAVLCCERIAARKPSNEAAIFMGDLNAGEGNIANKTLGKSLRDTFGELHPKAKFRGTFGGWKGRSDGNRIDYIYVTTKGWKVVEAAILRDHSADNRYPSDHYPVNAKLILE
tara:strand:- start:1391 stop:2275 length:885 start_codon:yes stop_codon:yes gene_type:complete